MPPPVEQSDEKIESSSESRTEKRRVVQLRGLSSLERLRDRIEVAAHELKRLRDENEALSHRVRELESKSGGSPAASLAGSEQDAELLRRKISGFIEAIDRYLERERSRA